MPAFLVSTSAAPLPAEAAIASLRALSSLSSSSPSDLSTSVARFDQHTTSTELSTRFASSSSTVVKRYVVYPAPTAIVVIVVVLSVLGILLALSNAHHKRQQIDEERQYLNRRRAVPISDLDFRSNVLGRSTTSRSQEVWQQGIAKPPPVQKRLSRRDSAVLFGTGAGSRLPSEPHLSAHEVEASGVLRSEIADPPPAYAPRRA